jgi:nodulation protein E
MNRVAVTGIGVFCSIGSNTAQFWESLAAGRCGIVPLQTVDCTNLRCRNGAEVSDYQGEDYFPHKSAELMDRFAQFAVIAAREAVQQAGIEWTPELRGETAIVTGACIGGKTTEDQAFLDVYRLNKSRISPLTIPRIMANAGASHISMEFGITGPAFTLSTACSSSGHALGLAYQMVRSGATPLAIAGGSEAPFSFGVLKAWEAMRVVSPTLCRPFCRERNGMVLGEGGAMLVLESMDRAQARGASILGEIVGFGMSSDASHITQPNPQGAVIAMRKALDDAGLEPAQIAYINAHGTGTDVNDPTETSAIRSLFGAHADRLAVSSTKSMHGHALGAAAALEAAASVLALRNGIVPPTVNFGQPDPACDLDYVPNQARALQAEYCLSNSFAFGGLNATLAFRRV